MSKWRVSEYFEDYSLVGLLCLFNLDLFNVNKFIFKLEVNSIGLKKNFKGRFFYICFLVE